MTSISVGGVILSDCLSQSEKVQNFYCSENWKCYRIRQFGMELGAGGGPIGVVIGGIIGGFIGEVSGNLLGKAIDHFTQFNLQIDFNQNKKSKVEDGYLAYLGTPPQDKLEILQFQQHKLTLIWLFQDIGIQFNEYKEKDPDDSCKSITFKLLAITEEYVNDDEILQQFFSHETNIIDLVKVKISLENIKQL
ncbi:unnamed protein product [Paramecium pentaurelia]|uniref:Uncharacterized protein n=1 Tax=Paramecium pentaurelia TaxID=43138 RepID=A0A8S1U975_9CILI|nr:unnamed protein product [Paramecium pentaurelia]